MTRIYEVLEVHDRQQRPLGKYRLVCWMVDEPEKISGLCDHSHPTPEDALKCSAANRILDDEFRERIAMEPKRLNS